MQVRYLNRKAFFAGWKDARFLLREGYDHLLLLADADNMAYGEALAISQLTVANLSGNISELTTEKQAFAIEFRLLDDMVAAMQKLKRRGARISQSKQ